MKSFIKDNRGSFTFEATLVLPAVFLFTLMGVFLCIIIFQMGTAHYVAEKAASQVAYSWNNSNKDLETGEFDKQFYPGLEDDGADGLYWRLFDNDILQIFGLGGLFSSDDGPLNKKITKAGVKYNSPLKVEIDYKNNLIYSEVQVKATSNLFLPPYLKKIMGLNSDELTATSSRVVTDSPELIRTFNFSKYVWEASGLGDAASDLVDSVKEFME
ncbi:hypothetical protein JOC34_000230 [Virgibacillus halotolerans]|uniref:TadE/TadG family type IV pilus assembly protein n=1 Tax=Virgibacillus halotolerans TaxID=1071053 RepID=UPI00195FC354|nr:pilus assembly protein [Virgibacillus halotolerans]MBM7597873.1 hypothetical protein [Virgibacillus halotolerans]